MGIENELKEKRLTRFKVMASEVMVSGEIRRYAVMLGLDDGRADVDALAETLKPFLDKLALDFGMAKLEGIGLPTGWCWSLWATSLADAKAKATRIVDVLATADVFTDNCYVVQATEANGVGSIDRVEPKRGEAIDGLMAASAKPQNPNAIKLDETKDGAILADWYRAADDRDKMRSPEDLAKFVHHLCDDYGHDYGTICHAIAAASLAAAHVVDRSDQGGITGFQAGAIMWEWLKHWNQWGGEPRRLVDYGDLLAPHYEYKFKTITPDTWKWVQAEAKANIEKTKAGDENFMHVHKDVLAHWESIAAGKIPFGLTVYED